MDPKPGLRGPEGHPAPPSEGFRISERLPLAAKQMSLLYDPVVSGTTAANRRSRHYLRHFGPETERLGCRRWPP